jgi:hypothetical protein
MANLDQLRARGRIRELVEALEAELSAPLPPGSPYREAAAPLAEAARRHELGRWQWQLARFDAADRNLARALEVREGLLGPSHPDTLDTLERIAALRHYQRRDGAGDLFRGVVAAREATLGRDAAATAISLRNYGAHLRDEGDPRAGGILIEARDSIEARLGTEHPDYAAALKAHALHLIHQEQHGEWRGLDAARRAWSVTLRIHGDDHPFTGGAILLLARGEETARRLRPARRRYEQARDVLAPTCGEDHPLVAFALGGLGNISFAESKVEQAIEHWEDALRRYRVTYPTSDFAVGLMFQLAEAALYLGQRDEGQAWIDRAVAEADVVGRDRIPIDDWLALLRPLLDGRR